MGRTAAGLAERFPPYTLLSYYFDFEQYEYLFKQLDLIYERTEGREGRRGKSPSIRGKRMIPAALLGGGSEEAGAGEDRARPEQSQGREEDGIKRCSRRGMNRTWSLMDMG